MHTTRRQRRASFLLRLHLVLLAGACASGCLVVSLQPFYDERSIEFDGALVGTYKNAEEKAEITIEKGAWNAYRFIYQEDTERTVLTGYRTLIGGRTYLDVYPESGESAPPFMVKAHGLLAVERTGTGLVLRVLSYDWFKTAVEKRQLTDLTFGTDSERQIVLTSETGALRAWVEKHAREEGVFADSATFVKR